MSRTGMLISLVSSLKGASSLGVFELTALFERDFLARVLLTLKLVWLPRTDGESERAADRPLLVRGPRLVSDRGVIGASFKAPTYLKACQRLPWPKLNLMIAYRTS